MSDADVSYSAALEEVASKQQITEVLYRYCQGCDRSDAEILRSCFHPDSITDHGGVVISSWEWIPAALAWLENRVAVTHMVTNPLIQLSGDRAISDCHFVAYNRSPLQDGPGWEEFLVKGRYLDRFERRSGAWKIVRRIGIHDLERVTKSPPQADQVSGDRRSGKAPDDPFYALLADLQKGW